MPMVAGLFLVLGLGQTAIYLLQFPFYRVMDVGSSAARAVVLPRDYCDALAYVRQRTPAAAVMLDDHSRHFNTASVPLVLGERRFFLPTPHSKAASGDPDSFADRDLDWKTWAASEFRDAALASRFAQRADIMILAIDDGREIPFWTLLGRCGRFCLYGSQKRSQVEVR